MILDKEIINDESKLSSFFESEIIKEATKNRKYVGKYDLSLKEARILSIRVIAHAIIPDIFKETHITKEVINDRITDGSIEDFKTKVIFDNINKRNRNKYEMAIILEVCRLLNKFKLTE